MLIIYCRVLMFIAEDTVIQHKKIIFNRHECVSTQCFKMEFNFKLLNSNQQV